MLKESMQKINQFAIQGINRGFFDKEHPEVNLGEWMRRYTVSHLSNLKVEETNKIENIIQDLYTITYDNLVNYISNTDEKAIVKVIKYKDKEVPNDKERLYISIKIRTIRRTEITTLCRFYKSNNQIYIGLDSYALGKLNWFMFIGLNLLWLIILIPTLFALLGLIIADLATLFYGLQSFSIGLLFTTLFSFIFKIILSLPGIFLGVWIWGDIIRGLNQKESLERAIRQRFHKTVSTNSFDLDDILIYLKTVIPLVLNSNIKAFEKNGINVKDTNDYLIKLVEEIQNVRPNNLTVNGNVNGTIFGDQKNQMYS